MENEMGIIAWIVVGLIAGALAKMLMPGAEGEPHGWLGTMILGIVGAVVGGWVWNLAFNRDGANGINIGSIVVSVVGACIVLGVYRLLKR